MSRRLERALLLFSLMLNVAFVSLAAVRTQSAPGPRSFAEPRRAAFAKKWHHRRVAVLSRVLGLDRQQRVAMRENLRLLRPRLHATREELARARRAFRRALERRDMDAARAEQGHVSSAQARLDSLSAEAILLELVLLSEPQRQRYLRWTFPPRGKRHRGPGGAPGFPAPRPDPREGFMLRAPRHAPPERQFPRVPERRRFPARALAEWPVPPAGRRDPAARGAPGERFPGSPPGSRASGSDAPPGPERIQEKGTSS
ncbi:MAG: hypothetical protein ACE5G2_08050 [Candidatus Krumholzibacteriia bacterium]